MTKKCDECGRVNSRVRKNKEFKKKLCETCYKTFKKNQVKYFPPHGEIHYDKEGKLICHICGRSYRKLTTHILQKHKIDSSKYKEIFELNRKQSLVSEELKKIYRQNKNTKNIFLYRVTFKKGHTASKKPKRLQAIKNRIGMKYKIKEGQNG